MLLPSLLAQLRLREPLTACLQQEQGLVPGRRRVSEHECSYMASCVTRHSKHLLG